MELKGNINCCCCCYCISFPSCFVLAKLRFKTCIFSSRGENEYPVGPDVCVCVCVGEVEWEGEGGFGSGRGQRANAQSLLFVF